MADAANSADARSTDASGEGELRVGFIGLGNMGGRMAKRLTEAGVSVLGHDRRDGAAREAGATAAASAAQVAGESDLVLLSLPDSKVVEAVIYGSGPAGDGGVLAAAREGQIIIDLSTANPDSTRRIAALLAERGATYLDAGISGGAAAADKGTLTLMVGGDEAALERARGVLEHFATKVVRCGEVGAGHTVKLLNNFLNAIALSATAEVMVAGKKAGLDLERLLDVLNASSGVNFATINRFPHIIKGDYLEGGLTNTLMLKDVSLYLELVASLGVTSLHGSGPTAAFGLARQLGYADRISNTVVDAIGDVSGGVRLHEVTDNDDETGEQS
ncbi:3-hydroxyisobutyrate dehydrogenase [Pseudoclavibacter endophyticus]|uniref:NAD(P)-dependent oxidoreductase n=1 Tax=Pseudoclavibacter endophyticus TaxID=1778590 RepID=A0A6H9WE62_9MICO|nr:NAD(P)-dependent oxidoreductase [Pseudoclavibacter endophyticus]KAB1649169.1 NAD(P)-dependent oxidoreductase [Pseudoclavibacter endophyticus]GGA64889.1 3-hydroxyisobutyrate dehydrogenase [Pseudoclavibacter endophyticus]